MWIIFRPESEDADPIKRRSNWTGVSFVDISHYE